MNCVASVLLIFDTILVFLLAAEVASERDEPSTLVRDVSQDA